MRELLISLFVVSLVALNVNAIHNLPFTSETYEDNVLILDNANFDEEIKNYDILLVDFSIPWCTHCKLLYPEYTKAAETLRSHEPEYYLAKVDTFKNEALKKRFHIKHFPT